jgi:hypothetical protein
MTAMELRARVRSNYSLKWGEAASRTVAEAAQHLGPLYATIRAVARDRG